MNDDTQNVISDRPEMNRRGLIQQSLLGSLALAGATLIASPHAIAADTPNLVPPRPLTKIRRVVTGHNPQGKSIIVKDEMIDYPGLLWSTLQDQVLADHNPEKRDLPNTLPRMESPAGDIRWMIGQIGPTKKKRGEPIDPATGDILHRTKTIDYVYIVSGEISMYVEAGKEVDLHPGDFVIQRNTMHAWRNYGTVPCVILTTMFGVSDTFPPLPA